jgi:LDH2 family malate/lactate/ureidoglycolate dehydrogenase
MAVSTSEYRLSSEDSLKLFVARILEKTGVAPADAATVGEVLVASDIRGIESHGVPRLKGFYVDRIRNGTINPRPTMTTLRETATSLALDAGNGLGQPASKFAIEQVIAKAKECGSAFGTVRNSNHFGIAGYYAMMALEHDMIGIASTNTMRAAAPTFGRDLLLGTNPFAYAIPAQDEPDFVLDFATTTVPRGKIEVYERKGLPLKPGWAIDADGNETLDPQEAVNGALLPLGGFGNESGGYKGYGLGMLVEILCGVLAGGTFGMDIPLPTDPQQEGAISHFFAAFRIDGFRDPAEFKKDMDEELRSFKNSKRAEGQDRIFVAGEIEHEKTLYNREHGVPVHIKVWNELEQLALDLDVPFAIAKA